MRKSSGGFGRPDINALQSALRLEDNDKVKELPLCDDFMKKYTEYFKTPERFIVGDGKIVVLKPKEPEPARIAGQLAVARSAADKQEQEQEDAVMTLKTPVRVEDEDYGYMVECKTFEEYARAMQFPDPTDVVIPIGTQNLIAGLINEGKIDISEAFSTCRNNYQYDDRGREYIEFPSEAEMIDILKTCKSYKGADSTRMADQLAAARHQAAQERSENRKERSVVHDNYRCCCH